MHWHPFYTFTSGEAVAPPPAVVGQTPAGRATPDGKRRRRFMLPDGTFVIATHDEVAELVNQFSRKDGPLPAEPKTRAEKRRARNKTPQSVPAQIALADLEWQSVPDVSEPVLMPILPPGIRFEPMPADLRARILELQRRKDDEDILLFIL